MKLSVVIPCYKAPEYLRLCLESALRGAHREHEYIVIVDGHPELYRDVLEAFEGQISPFLFERNEGLSQALNQGVWLANQAYVLLVNEDNVFPQHWDRRLLPLLSENKVLSLNQIEPEASKFNFPERNLGQRASDFSLQEFWRIEPQYTRHEALPDGRIFPFVLSKRWYMQVGGFDTLYSPSPHYCDLDFFLKLELHGELHFERTRALHLYHFGQKSSSQPDASPQEQAQAAQHFQKLADRARQLFQNKWGIQALRHSSHSLKPRVRYQYGIRYQERHEDHKIAAIVNYCSNEARFLKPCLDELRHFCAQIILPVCDHFFDGEPEDRAHLKQIAEAHPDVHLAGFRFHFEPRPPWYWPSLARVVGVDHLEPDIEYVLFLDVDEIFNGAAMRDWLNTLEYRHYAVQSLSNYWYFRQSQYRAKSLEDSVILAQRDLIQAEFLMDPMERIALFESIQGPRKRAQKGLNGEVLVHHYSWVRTEAEMLKKVQSWSHREERDWVAAVKAEFAQEFSGRDFVHGYEFEEVEPAHEIAL